MSHLGPIGDRGQRYEVVQVQHDGTRMRWGWTERADGGNLKVACLLHPLTKEVEIVDRAVPGRGCGGGTPPRSDLVAGEAAKPLRSDAGAEGGAG